MHETIKKDLYNFVKSNQNLPKAVSVRRFTDLGYQKRSVYRCLDVREKDKTFKRKKGIVFIGLRGMGTKKKKKEK
ncbi:hypothetical protein BpHYR1_053053 [Brachionus plicatilis]|uniref:Uncharacterized protein n=1 Tax=Brachionus plicatilis TaxID=10195 RepID=A0A3M7T0H8_BRAPC|nr:hypothetical protein BpHYR1_053053 [Brachionus plicatilis]